MAAKRILTFTIAEVAPLVVDATSTKERRLSYGQQCDPALHKGGVVKKDGDGFPDASNIDRSKIPPTLWLVKDHGVYLMSPSVMSPGQETAVLAYAHEANPDKLEFDDWYGAARAIMGGDDCCEALPIEWFQEAVKSGKRTFRLQILARSIRMVL